MTILYPNVGILNTISQLLSSDGTGGGITSPVGDYSANPLALKITPPADRTYRMRRVLISIEDTGTFSAGTYGALRSGLRIGITAFVADTSGVRYTLTAFPIKTNADWASHCYDGKPVDFGAGNNLYVLRWTFAKAGAPVVLQGAEGAFLQFTFNDDFRGLVNHRFVVQGYEVDPTVEDEGFG